MNQKAVSERRPATIQTVYAWLRLRSSAPLSIDPLHEVEQSFPYRCEDHDNDRYNANLGEIRQSEKECEAFCSRAAEVKFLPEKVQEQEFDGAMQEDPSHDVTPGF